MNHSYLINRRSFLRGTGVAMSLPLLEIMSPAIASAAAANKKQDLRLCVLYKGCGVNPSSWDITGGGETKFNLSTLLSPLERHKNDIAILSGIDSDHRANGTHVSATLAFMTGQTKKSNFKQAPSFDQVIADEIGDRTPIKSLVLRGDPYIDNNDSSENFLSYDKEGQPLPVAADPEVVFNSLFRGFNNKAYRDSTKSILDQVKDSYQAVANKASNSDRATLEQYLTSIRDVEKEIDQFKSNDDADRQKRIAGVREFTAAQNMGERVKAMLDLIAIAFWTDTTHVATMMMAHTESRGIYDFIGINEEFHYLSHFVRNRQVIPHFDRINQWHASQVAYFIDKLKSFKDGDQTLFDNSMVLYGSGLKHADYHSVADLPLVLTGGGGGEFKLGRYVRYRHAPNSNLLLKLMQMMGVQRDSFANSSEPLPGITETGTFNPAAVDDGTWKIQSIEADKIVVKGLLKVQVTADDPNLYLIQLSDGSNVEIRSGFGNINGNKMDLHVGSVMTLTGEIRKIGDKQVITKVVNYDLDKLPQQ
ncbi:MAG: hypothetical protein ACI9G1_001365 [Pirellulaceae bacterium]|jgi:hypothetical protein